MKRKIADAISIFSLLLVCLGVTGGIVANYHILRTRKALIVVKACDLEMAEAQDQKGADACAAVIEYQHTPEGLADFYNTHKSYFDNLIRPIPKATR